MFSSDIAAYENDATMNVFKITVTQELLARTPIVGTTFIDLRVWDGGGTLMEKFVKVTVEDRTYVASTTPVNIGSNFVYNVYGMVLLRSIAELKSDISDIEYYLDDAFLTMTVGLGSHNNYATELEENYRFDRDKGIYVNPWYTHNLEGDGYFSLWYGINFYQDSTAVRIF